VFLTLTFTNCISIEKCVGNDIPTWLSQSPLNPSKSFPLYARLQIQASAHEFYERESLVYNHLKHSTSRSVTSLTFMKHWKSIWVWWLQIKQLTQACVEKSKDKTQPTFFHQAFRFSCISGFWHPSSSIEVNTLSSKKIKKGKLYIHSSFMSWHIDMHLAQTIITYVALGPWKNLSDRSSLHSSKWLSNPSNYKILINQVFLAYWGFDTLITTPMFLHLVFFYISGLWHPDPCTKVLTPCFFYISRLRHLDSCIKVLTPCFSCTSRLRHLDPCTKVSTLCFSCLSQDFYTLPKFLRLIFSSLSRGFNTLPRFQHLVSSL